MESIRFGPRKLKQYSTLTSSFLSIFSHSMKTAAKITAAYIGRFNILILAFHAYMQFYSAWEQKQIWHYMKIILQLLLVKKVSVANWSWHIHLDTLYWIWWSHTCSKIGLSVESFFLLLCRIHSSHQNQNDCSQCDILMLCIEQGKCVRWSDIFGNNWVIKLAKIRNIVKKKSVYGWVNFFSLLSLFSFSACF